MIPDWIIGFCDDFLCSMLLLLLTFSQISPSLLLTFQVTCYDWDSDGSHDLIGFFDTTYAEFQVIKKYER